MYKLSQIKNIPIWIFALFLFLISILFIHVDQFTDILPAYLIFYNFEFKSLLYIPHYLVTYSLYGLYYNFLDFFFHKQMFADILGVWANIKNSGMNLFEVGQIPDLYRGLYSSASTYWISASLNFIILIILLLFSYFISIKEKLFFNRVFWWLFFNPILFIVVFIYGRPEIFWLLPFFISIYYVKDLKPFKSFLFLILAIFTKFVALFFLPLYCVYFYFSFRGTLLKNKYINYVMFVGLLLIVIIMSYIYMDPILTYITLFFQSDRVNQFLHVKYTISSGINMDNPFNTKSVYIVILLSFLTLVYSIWRDKMDFNDYISFNIILCLIYFSFAYTPTQYFAWIIPFYFLSYKSIKKFWLLHSIQIICFVVTAFIVPGKYLFIPYVAQYGPGHLGKDLLSVQQSSGINLAGLGLFVSNSLFTLMVAVNILIIILYWKKIFENKV